MESNRTVQALVREKYKLYKSGKWFKKLLLLGMPVSSVQTLIKKSGKCVVLLITHFAVELRGGGCIVEATVSRFDLCFCDLRTTLLCWQWSSHCMRKCCNPNISLVCQIFVLATQKSVHTTAMICCKTAEEWLPVMACYKRLTGMKYFVILEKVKNILVLLKF